ncbi:hypothetical protein N7462_003150 [Penicillium macrosclerotiorum]|uniref:uncharacterized protein n=1 Tax=Penicillium macrosclerotiorum TaxID=303699 RepID=UPI0025483276|nr:uncharacterized protein N7462_003150 [Penicillium macrosclerotiorum]KAJ5688758.1 hypothetical protein N7462_003150 [Penicillium macrosclerotiorum]
MKFLCCHGFGTSPEIMKHQLAKIKKHCHPSWEFHFVAGTFEGPPDPSIAAAFPGPYLCYSLDFDTASMVTAHKLIDDAFEKYGPFDGVLGFSTGAALLAAYLLEKAALSPETPLPVQFAIFCSPIPPLSADPIYTEAIFGSLSPDDQERIRSSDDTQILQLSEPIRSLVTLAAQCFDILKPVHGRPRSDFFDRDIINVPCIIRPDLYNKCLAIPTLHCWSKNDPLVFKESARLVESFCHPRLRTSYHHSAVHNLPRSTAEVRAMVSAMEIMISQSQQPRL